MPAAVWPWAIRLLAAALLAPAATATPARAGTADVTAILTEARRLEFGIGVAPDLVQAMGLYCQAAAAGDRGATMQMAAWLLADDSPDYDPALAAAWLRRLQRSDRGARPTAGSPPRCPGQAAPPPMMAASATLGPATLGKVVPTALIEAISAEYRVDPALVTAVIAVESGFRADAVSPKGAMGLMQLMPGTARDLAVDDPFDPEQNLRGGVRHLARLLDTYRGQLPMALAAYNAGEARVDRCGCVPAITETTAYVDQILALYPAGPVSR